MFRRHHAIVAFCSLSTIGLLTAGCEEEEKATPQVIIGDARLARGAESPDCKDSRPLFAIGSFGVPALDEPSVAVKDGAQAEQGTVSIACSVTSAGNGEFNVDATVALSGATGGAFHVDGKFKTTGEQTNIRARFSSIASANTYEQSDRGCIVHYDTPYQGVAAGRVWGRVDCPKALLSGADTSCAATATFRFENCAQ
ncbi:MAG TPA: hypothetical protein VM925_33330 [Labilithrix sp.]|nr:hypothetical protein [Labilithrix sp.]